MNCTRCHSKNYHKAGIVNGKQRYKCKDCHYYYTVARKSTKKPDDIKRLAIHMYLECLGFRAIGRILGISYGTVYNWIKKLGEQTVLPPNDTPTVVMELDEIYSYVQSKNYVWTWVAVDRYKRRFIDSICGKRDTTTFKQLYNKLNPSHIDVFCSDYWKSYAQVIPSNQHIQSKAQTFTVEGYNSRIRHYLVRFKRKTKCYSKSVQMMEYSLKLLFLYLNGEIDISI